MEMKNKSTLILCLIAALMLAMTATPGRAQFLDSASGLLQAPSAEMNPSGTFMITNNWMDKHTLAAFPWGYRTFQYGFDITFWSRFEFAYVMTIIDGSKMPDDDPNDPLEPYWKIMFNQDRHFYAKIQLLKENEFGWKWVPSIAVGVSDPTTGGISGDYWDRNVKYGGNGYFNRYYAVATKHFNTKIGEIGVHFGYQYNQRLDYHLNGPCGGLNWRPKWVQNDWVRLNLIAEYDARTFNLGMVASIYKDHFDLMFEWQNLQWISFGIRYKLVLY